MSAEEAALALLRVVRRDLYDAHPRAMLEAIVTGEAIDELQAEINHLTDELNEYRCPHCGSDVITREHIEYDEKNSGLLEMFECGYQTDGSPVLPCPFGPDFPHLEDYNLEIHHSESYPFECTCYALPKTDHARRVHLRHGFGRTADEARECVIEYYNYLKTPAHQPFRGKWISRS